MTGAPEAQTVAVSMRTASSIPEWWRTPENDSSGVQRRLPRGRELQRNPNDASAATITEPGSNAAVWTSRAR